MYVCMYVCRYVGMYTCMHVRIVLYVLPSVHFPLHYRFMVESSITSQTGRGNTSTVISSLEGEVPHDGVRAHTGTKSFACYVPITKFYIHT